MKVCSLENCEKKYFAKNYCSIHYARWRAHGSPEISLKQKNLKCSMANCDNKHDAKGLCNKHSKRFRKFGTAEFLSKREMNSQQRIISNVLQNENGCWEWMGTKCKQGYGVMCYKAKVIKAHRLSYAAFIADFPKKMLICHKCDNPSCCNPNHLFIGTHQDNFNDMINKKRLSLPKAENHYKAKFSNEQVKKIKLLLHKMNNSQLGNIYGVDRRVISCIRANKTYKSVGAV